MQKLFGERVVGLCDALSREDWSVTVSTRIITVRRKICRLDPVRLSKLLDEYDDLQAGMHCKTIDRIYAEGFRDGVSFMKF